jgi:hypothetical protein
LLLQDVPLPPLHDLPADLSVEERTFINMLNEVGTTPSPACSWHSWLAVPTQGVG